MSATKRPPEEIESPGYGYGPNELPFYPSDGHGLLESVVAAIRHSLDKSLAHHADTAAGDFIGLLVQASQRLGRELRETGFGVEEDALRAALPKLEKAAQLRGSPDGIDRFTEQLAGDVNAPIGKHLHAASNILDWCIAGARARLAEMEDEASPPPSFSGASARAGADVFWPEWLEDRLSKHLEAVTGLQMRMDDNDALYDLRTTRGNGDPGMVAWGAEYVLRGVENRLASVLECPEEHADDDADATVSVLWELGSELAVVWAGVRSVDGAGDLAENLLQEARALKQLGTRVDEESAKWRSQGRPPLRGGDAA